MNYAKAQQAKSYYTPRNKDKYKGEYPIRILSSWEEKFCSWCDSNPNIIYWSSEPFGINYVHPIEQRDARYYFDFLIKVKNKQGDTDVWCVEIKPYRQCLPPTKHGNKKKSTVLHEQKTWKINEAKWKAAQRYCKMKGWKFKIITEKELFGK